MAPKSLQTPLVIVATVATVIASQAVISGAFSMTRQAVQLGFLPRLRVLQTSAQEIGQIFVPFVNVSLAILVAAVILIFQSSNALGSAYGIAVTGTMLITDFLAIAVAIYVWKWQPWRAVLGATFFILMDAVFFSANTLKLLDGGWFPILLSIGMIILMTTWHKGFDLAEANVKQLSPPLLDFIANEIDNSVIRTPGTAIYMANDEHFTPMALKRTMQHFNVVHQVVAVLSVKYELVPYVDEATRVDIRLCDKGFIQIAIHSGFMEKTNVPEILKAHWPASLQNHYEPICFMVRRLAFIPENSNGMRLWRKKLFNAMFRNGAWPTEVFSLPEGDTIGVSIALKI